jgi:orotidine-5'-phosphate decarboxylase
MDFIHQLCSAWDKNNSLLCVGLDPDFERLPTSIQGSDAPYFSFNKEIIDATADLVCAYKPNSAFYEARGATGIQELQLTCAYIQENYPFIPIILDFKRGDIGNTNQQYARFAFDYIGADAVTIQPWCGAESVQAFLDYKDKGIIVLVRTSNPGAKEFQDLEVNGEKLYISVAKNIRDDWNKNGNCLLVVGATYPNEMRKIRRLMGDGMIFLVPGLGVQGGDLKEVLKAGLNSSGSGLIINSSREVIFASKTNFAEAARAKAEELKNAINERRGSL